MKSDVKSRVKAENRRRGDGSNGLPASSEEDIAAIPWQQRPPRSTDVVWRHSGNPIIGRHHMPGVQGVYNSAVAPYGDGFVGVFRLEKRCRFPHLHVGWSEDGIDWHIESEPIEFAKGDPGSAA